MQLSQVERTLLRNQLETMQVIRPDLYSDYDQMIDILESGYEAEYHRVLVPEDTMSTERSRWVLTVLDMYRAIHFSLRDLPGDHPLRSHHNAEFEGFDGNNESVEMYYTEFVLEKQGRFEELHRTGGNYNTHFPTLSRYEAMLAKWESFGAYGDRLRLNPEQLEELLNSPVSS